MIEGLKEQFRAHGFDLNKDRSKGNTLVYSGRNIAPFWVDVVGNHVDICRRKGGIGGGKMMKLKIWSGEIEKAEDIKYVINTKLL